MWLVAGLGNPGPKYRGNRHNVGFMVVERLLARHGAGAFREKFQGRLARAVLDDQDVAVLEPSTYMNLSGRAVQAALRFFKLELDRLVVVHDELDLPFGAVRVKSGGGTAGHKGLKSIVECCGGPGFSRLRIGIGRPRSGTVEGYVLSDFSRQESAELPDVLESASAALEDLLLRGVEAAMNAHNVRDRT